jgi:hypothetical protein
MKKNTHKSTSEYRTPTKREHDFVFSMNTSSKGYLGVSFRSLYVELRSAFGKTLDRLGKGQKEESPGAKHKKITLHSFRRWVKSTISDFGYYDYSEWFIGHGGSTYYRKSEKEKAEIFKMIENRIGLQLLLFCSVIISLLCISIINTLLMIL